MDYKYKLNSENNALVLKRGKNGRLGGVEFFTTHDSIYGSSSYEDVRICLSIFRRGVGEQYPKFPPFLKDFNIKDVIDLRKRSKHCHESIDELAELIHLATLYNENIVRVDGKCTKMCLPID